MDISEPKRRKTAQRSRDGYAQTTSHQACAACKKRKVRCDAAQPSCSYCATHAKDCVYPPPFVRAQCSQSYVPPLRLPTVAVLYGLKANKQADMSMPLKLD